MRHSNLSKASKSLATVSIKSNGLYHPAKNVVAYERNHGARTGSVASTAHTGSAESTISVDRSDARPPATGKPALLKAAFAHKGEEASKRKVICGLCSGTLLWHVK